MSDCVIYILEILHTSTLNMSKHSKYCEDGKKYIQIATNDTTLLVLKLNMQKYLREIGYNFFDVYELLQATWIEKLTQNKVIIIGGTNK